MGAIFSLRPAAWFAVLLFFIGAVSPCFAKGKIPLAPIPSWVERIPAKINTQVKPGEISYGYHSLLRDIQFDLPGKTVFNHLAFKVFSEDGVQPVSEITVDYDPNYEKLVFHQVQIWRHGKLIDKKNARFKVIQREKDSEKYIYNEELSAIIILDDVRIDDVVEYAYSVQGRNPVFGDKFFSTLYLESYDPIDELFLRIRTSPKRPLYVKLENSKTKPVVATTGNLQTYTWHLKNIPGHPTDSEVPSWYDPYACVYVSEFKNWAELVNWALPLYETAAPLSQELLRETEQIKKKYGSMEDRITAAVRFVQDKIRYLGFESGISGYKPFPPSQVFRQRFGDCKDKSLLLVTMLRKLEVEAHPALVNSNFEDQVQNWLPSVYAFNHCIVLAGYNGKKIWIDPTISLQRGSYDSIATPDYKAALVIKKGSTGFTRMQVPQHSRVRVTENFNFKDLDGPVTLDVKTEYFGYEADMMRSRFAGITTKQMEKDYLNYYANLYPDISVDRELVFVDDEQNNKFTTFEEYTIRDLWTNDSVKQRLSADFYPQMVRDRLLMPKTLIRKMPIGLSYPLDIEQTLNMYMPEGWTSEPESRIITDKTFRYQKNVSYQASSRCITYTYRYKNLQPFVPVAGAGTYIKKQKEILNDLGFQLYQDKGVEATVSQFSLNWAMVVLALAVLALSGFGAYKLYYYNPPQLTYSPDGYRIGGWLGLLAFGLSFSPLLVLINLWDANYFNLHLFKELVKPESSAYNPALAITLVGELAGNIALLAFSLLVIYLLYARRTSFPRLATIFLLANLAFIIMDSIAVELVHGKPVTWFYPDVIKRFIYCAIWVPYLSISIRVKETFVNRLPDPAGLQRQPVEEPVAAGRQD
ncbi:MAG: DUF3857 domain-containing protein [Adhaeribacter sp.]